MVNLLAAGYYLRLNELERDFRIESFLAAGLRLYMVYWKNECDGERNMLFSSWSAMIDFVTHNLDLNL